jgi:hypothetical protein
MDLSEACFLVNVAVMKLAVAAEAEEDENSEFSAAAAFKEIAELHKSNRKLDREIEKLHQLTLKRLARIRGHLAYVQANH